MSRIWKFLSDYSLLLIIGAIIALFWANFAHSSYENFIEYVIWGHNSWIGHAHYDANGVLEYRNLTIQYLVNDVLMALFFAMAGKEVWEAIILKDGSLKGKKSLAPLIATVGGMLGPVLVYLGIAAAFGSSTYEALKHGWAVPTATDIAFSYLVGRLIFGAGHPAVRFLLLLAIADDAGGLIILAVAYPQAPLQLGWIFTAFASSFFIFLLFNFLPHRLDRGKENPSSTNKIRKIFGVWPYVIGGIISWFSFQNAGIHAALGLLPIIPAIPHADRGFGIFAEAEKYLTDMLNTLEHSIATPVQIILFFFGLCNAGVLFTAIGPGTWAVFGGLIIGKPLGIFVMGWFAAVVLRLGLSDGMSMRDLLLVGTIASIGFTVSLFVAVAAFSPGDVQDAAKMGALFSFAGAVISLILAKTMGVRPESQSK